MKSVAPGGLFSVVTAVMLWTSWPAEAQDGCGTILDAQGVQAAELNRRAGLYEPPGGVAGDEVYHIPIALHIVRQSDGSGGMTAAELNLSVLELNDAFLGWNMTFCPVGNPIFIDSNFFYFEIDTLAEVNLLRSTLVVPNAINIYFTPNLAIDGGLQLCGISSFTHSPVQGIVMRNSCTAAGDNDSTLAHEVGHYFDLYHTHETAFGVECAGGSNCSWAGDQICDTPADPTLGSNNVDETCHYVGTTPPPCFADPGYNPDTGNFLSYAPKDCRDHFSLQQGLRMKATLLNLRPELALSTCPDGTPQDPTPGMELLSMTADGQPGLGPSSQPAWSADGHFVAFTTGAPNLAPGASGPAFDVLVRDQVSGQIELVSKSSSGVPGNGSSGSASVSADGRYVTFRSYSTNLVAGVPPGSFGRIYRHDRMTGQTIMVSRSSAGAPNNKNADLPIISDDGRYVAYVSSADNLVTGDTNNASDVFRTDILTGQTIRVSVSSTGTQGDAMSGGFDNAKVDMSPDGSVVAFPSMADNFSDSDGPSSDIFVRDIIKQTTTCVSLSFRGGPTDGASFAPTISANGRWVAYYSLATNIAGDDSNGMADVFLHDLNRGQTTRISLASDGSQANGISSDPSISYDGSVVAFVSTSTNLDPSDTTTVHDVYLKNLLTGKTTMASPRGPWGSPGGAPIEPAIKPDGSAVAFYSSASNLTPNDVNGFHDIFSYTPPRALGDLDGDGVIASADLGLLLSQWGACPPIGYACGGDLNGDGIVDGSDIGLLLAAWSDGPEP